MKAEPNSLERESWQRGEYTISTDTSLLDINLIHDFISNHSYWGSGRARDVVERSIENSMAFGVYHGDQQVGFARIVTDYATFAWVADVFVVPEHRGRGLSKWLMEVIIAHPKLQGFAGGFWRPRTHTDCMSSLVSTNCVVLNVGWNDPIRT